MFRNIIVVAMVALTQAHEGHDVNGFRRCGVVDLTDEQFHAAEAHRVDTLKGVQQMQSGGTIPVHVHTITGSGNKLLKIKCLPQTIIYLYNRLLRQRQHDYCPDRGPDRCFERRLQKGQLGIQAGVSRLHCQ